MGLKAPFSATFHGFLLVCLFLKEAESCKIGWSLYKGHCYGLFNNQLTWADAENYCHNLGGHLASIHFADELGHVGDYIRRLVRDGQNVWIGMSSPEKEQRWQWVDHTSVRYLPWEDGEPNDFFFNENCVEMLNKKDYMRWNDKKCTVKQPFLCKTMAI